MSGIIKKIFIEVRKSLEPEMERLAENYPVVFGFLKKRLGRNHFSGLTLTVLLVSFVYVLFLFIGVIDAVLDSGLIIAADAQISNLLYLFRNEKAVDFFLWVTVFGKLEVALFFALAAVFIFWLYGKKDYILALVLGVAGSEVFVFLGKSVVHRPRPLNAVYSENYYSFPSGHAAISIALFGFFAYAAGREIKSWKKKILIYSAAVSLVALIGFSRLYLDVHFLSDVWSGYLLGGLWLVSMITFCEWSSFREKIIPPVPKSFSANKKTFAFASVFLAVAFYSVFAFYYRPAPNKIFDLTEAKKLDNPVSFFSNDLIPKYTKTLGGRRQEPISFIIVADDDNELIAAIKKSGWFLADSINFASIKKIAGAALLNENYPTAPMTPSFWNSRVNDFGFEKPTDKASVRERHHIRFWKTPFVTDEGRRIYAGTASLDAGIKWGITHTIDPAIDVERDYFLDDLGSAVEISMSYQVASVDPEMGVNFSGDPFFTDGKAYVIILQ